MAFFLRPSPFSFNVFSPALTVSASVAPSSSPARAAVWSVEAANMATTTAQLSVLMTELFMLVSSWLGASPAGRKDVRSSSIYAWLFNSQES